MFCFQMKINQINDSVDTFSILWVDFLETVFCFTRIQFSYETIERKITFFHNRATKTRIYRVSTFNVSVLISIEIRWWDVCRISILMIWFSKVIAWWRCQFSFMIVGVETRQTELKVWMLEIEQRMVFPTVLVRSTLCESGPKWPV